MIAQYIVIYDGNCNLCVTFTKVLESFDRGKIFSYIPMQDESRLNQLQITAKDCEMGMILIDENNLEKRWQGSDAAEEIVCLLPMGELFINTYRALPGMKFLGDKTYEKVRDHRYQLFGKTEITYYSDYSISCQINCDRNLS